METPVLYPDNDNMQDLEWEGGLEDPRVVATENGEYVMTYTSYDGTARLSVATSNDLINWQKHGPVFSGKFRDAWTKSGSIVCEIINSRCIATKIHGVYWMYWGEFHIHAATSVDLIHWVPVFEGDIEGRNYWGRPDHQDNPVPMSEPLRVFSPRAGRHDSDLVEPGPPAIKTEKGIVLIYNSKNKWCMYSHSGICTRNENDPSLQPGTYSAGQV